jgi:glycosyltransferase involved in cell wall biosynthesis
MKILQVCNKYPFPPKDGGSIAMINLAGSIRQMGHKVSLLAMKTPKHGWKIAENPSSSAYQEIFSVYVNTSIKPFQLLANLFFSGFPYNAQRFIDPGFRNKLVEVLQEHEYDIVQLEGLYLMPYADTIRKFSRAKIALRTHNIEHEIWKRMAGNATNKLIKPYLKILAERMADFETSCVNGYDMLVPVSERDQVCFAAMGNVKPSRVIPVGIDVSKMVPMDGSSEKNSFFFIGSLNYVPNREGLRWFIEKVWKRIVKKNASVKFYVAGSHAPEKFSAYLNRQQVIYMGEVEDAKHFMQSKGLMVVPLLSGGGIRVKIIEAMALGIPVVSTTLGAEGLNVTNGTNILITDDPEEFSNTVINLLENQTFFANIGNNARIFIQENMDGKILAADLLTFYNSHL